MVKSIFGAKGLRSFSQRQYSVREGGQETGDKVEGVAQSNPRQCSWQALKGAHFPHIS